MANKVKTVFYVVLVLGGLCAVIFYTRQVDFVQHRKKARYHATRKDLVFYNRVGKCGSRSLLDLMKRLSKDNNFKYISSKEVKDSRPVLSLRKKEMRMITNLSGPTFYSRQMHYMDFNKHGFPKPIYINLIRDPIERFASQYNFMKYGDTIREKSIKGYQLDINNCVINRTGRCSSDSTIFFRILQYLCGFDEVCLESTPESVELVKKHIDDEYLVIGMTEQFENSLRIFQKILPRYFKGAVKLWKQNQVMKNLTASRRLDELTEESKEVLRNELMVEEYEIYNYAKKKFENLKKKYRIS